MTELKNSQEFCPYCGANLQGAPIPLESQKNYGATHFSRKIAYYDEVLDRTTAFICPDCGGQWSRDVDLKRGTPQ
ncbi:hypothetical protein [Paenibacillus sp. 32352]|uniref:hypothetical protein n=1 Tax=Paenibacillus sp. 32352 TaxID=1969111 RepID=UPI0009AD68E4|nr:hypothetical protein [Paenibacillus sp. 32352]